MSERIPGPTPLPFFGNIFQLSSDEGIMASYGRFADVYGEIFEININGTKSFPISSARLLREVMDESRFPKYAEPSAQTHEAAVGLFEASTDNPDWAQAHRILMPTFGPMAIDTMFDRMRDISNQMCLKWARQADRNEEVVLTTDFTKVAFDVVALCAFNYRFNSFYSDMPHPYVEALNGFLGEMSRGFTRHWLQAALFSNHAQTEKNSATMAATARQIVEDRRNNPTDEPDMLNTLLYGKDPKTGEVMREALVINQIDTFLSAGHETTAGLMSFAFAHMIKNPHTLFKAQAEVDAVVGDAVITSSMTKKLKYVDAVLAETLRLTPPIPGFSKRPNPDITEPTIIGGGKYLIPKDGIIEIILQKCHTDPELFGDDAEEFKPERMMEDNPDYAEFRKAWKPFGNGVRSCIGQSFALQEATLVTAMVLRNFDLSFVDPNYEMKIKEAFANKPDNLRVRVKLRKGITMASLQARLHGASGTDAHAPDLGAPQAPLDGSKKLRIFYGSNTGTCQSLAQKFASSLRSLGVLASVQDADSATDDLVSDIPTIFISATYEGQPPDNAARFIAWLDALHSQEAKGLKYAVFGCGDKAWASSLWRIPKLLDSSLEALGGSRICAAGQSDVSKGSPLDDFESWQKNTLMPALTDLLSLDTSSVDEKPDDLSGQVEISTQGRAKHLADGMQTGFVKRARVLTAPGHPEKRELEITMPGCSSGYEPGDYLSVLPLNPPPLVRHILAHFALPWDATVTLRAPLVSSLPVGVPLAVADIFSGHVELSSPPARSHLQVCAKYALDATTRALFERYAQDDEAFETAISARRQSLFDLISAHAIPVPLPVFLSLLMPLRPRLYSISSSPLPDKFTCTITYSVVRSPATSSAARLFEGAASTFLADLQPGDRLQCAFKRTATANRACPFRLPADAARVPMLMFGAGTGIAPFRAFIQQRALLLQAQPDAELAPAVLFAGCRDPDADRLYGAEFDAWQRLSAVDVRYAFSRAPARSLGCRYVGERMQRDWAAVARLLDAGARVYVCGSAAFSRSLDDAAEAVFARIAGEQRRAVAAVRADFAEKIRGRAVDDIFD